MIKIRDPKSIYQIDGNIEKGASMAGGISPSVITMIRDSRILERFAS
jgi:hypothetical protein